MNIPVDDTFSGAYNPSPVDFGNIIETTSSVTTLLEIAGGTLPYTIVTVGFVGGAPAAGVSLVLTTTDVTDDTVAVATTAATPLGPFSGTIRARVDDAAGRSIQVDVDFDFVAAELFTNISDFIDSLNPTHRWKCNDVSGDVLDSGSGTTRDLTPVGTLTYEAGGPDASTESIDGRTSSDFARNSVGGMDEAASGTILAFVRNPNTGGVIISQNNTVNEAFQLQFARNPIGEVSPTSRLGFTAIESSFVGDRRVFEGDTDIDSHNADNLWHLYAWVQENLGTLPRFYIDGVEETGVFSTPTGGSPPPIDVWTDIGNANSRAVMFNGRFPSASGNYVAQASEICVLNGTLLDSTQLTALFDLITN